MPLTPYQDDYRNQITESLLTPPVKPNTPLSMAMSAIPTNLQSQFTAGMPSGMPQTPAGGVPGSGMAPTGPPIVPMQPTATQTAGGPMQGLGTRSMRRPRY